MRQHPLANLRIKTREDGTHRYYEGWDETYFHTAIERLHGVTPAGKLFLAQAPEYCRMERAIASRILAGKEIDKSALQSEFGFAGRIVNTAIIHAKGQLKSIQECAAANLEDAIEAIERKQEEYEEAKKTPGRRRELAGRKKHLAKLEARKAAAEKQIKHPSFFPGRAAHRKQTARGPYWRAEFEAKRSDHIGCVGSADEAYGNSTLQVHLGVTTVRHKRVWQWAELRHKGEILARFLIDPKKESALIAILQKNANPKKLEIVDGWVDADGKDIHPKKVAAMKKRGELPASTRPVTRAITVDRSAVTAMLIRQENGQWRLHLSHAKKERPEMLIPVGWMGVDLNVDSIAHACLSETQQLLSYGKDYFPRGGQAGARDEQFFTIINRLVKEAKERKLGMSLEFLQFEGSKRWLKNKLGSLLRAFPYKRIRAIFEERCRAAGVPLRFVSPTYSSVLGGLLTVKWNHLGRDQAAAAVIAARASAAGDAWLDRLCHEAVQAEKLPLRLNAKGLFGHNVVVLRPSVRTGTVGHQRDHPTPPHVKPPDIWWQKRCGRDISDVTSTARQLFRVALRDYRRAAEAPGSSMKEPLPKVHSTFLLDQTGPRPVMLKFEQG